MALALTSAGMNSVTVTCQVLSVFTIKSVFWIRVYCLLTVFIPLPARKNNWKASQMMMNVGS